MNLEQLGKTESHLVQWNNNLVHKDCVVALTELRESALNSGIDLAIASSFRSYSRQETIWNEKASGSRVLLDADSSPLIFDDLSPSEVLFAILKWSAIPGFSRHHWGSDFDIFDNNTVPTGYKLQLIPSEYGEQGIFSNLTNWFDSLDQSDFYRPYSPISKGVSYEPWHISYKPVATKYADNLTLESFVNEITKSSIKLKDEILQHNEEIFHNYIKN